MSLEHPLFVDLPRLREALKKYNATKTDIAVMEDISQFANRYGRAFTTEKAIAARNGLRRKAVSRSVNWIAARGFMAIKREKRGQDKHPRNNYYIAKPFRLSRPDKQSQHFNASKWQRWCEIGKKRFYNALKRKQAAQAAAGTIRDTAARMAGGKRPTTANASRLTPAQAREARQRRGGGFAGFGSVLSGLFPAASATVQPVKDDYSQQVPRGGWSQALREHEAAAAMASQQTQAAAPMSAAQPVPPIQQPPTQPTASEQRERKAQAYEELQSLRERLRQQGTASSQAPADDTARAVQDVARDYRRASRPAVMASPWASWAATPTAPADPTPRGDMAQARRELQQLRARRAAYSADPWATSTAQPEPIQQPQATPDMEQEAAAAWLAGLEATRRQAARDAANPWPAQPVPAVQ